MTENKQKRKHTKATRGRNRLVGNYLQQTPVITNVVGFCAYPEFHFSFNMIKKRKKFHLSPKKD